MVVLRDRDLAGMMNLLPVARLMARVSSWRSTSVKLRLTWLSGAGLTKREPKLGSSSMGADLRGPLSRSSGSSSSARLWGQVLTGHSDPRGTFTANGS